MKYQTWLGPLMVVVAALLWAFDGVAIRPLLNTLPVGLVVLVEHGLAFIVMIPFLIAARGELKKLQPADWAAFGWVALFGGVLGTMLFTKALFYVNFINLAVVILVQKLQPIFALTLAALVLHERLPRRFFGWAALAVAATYVITFPTLVPDFGTGGKIGIAALFSLGAAFAWGSGTVFSKRALRHANFQIGTYLRFGLTTALMLILTSVTGDLSKFDLISSRQWWLFGLIVITSGGSAMLIYYFGLARIKASVSTICELALPLGSILFEFLLRGRTLLLVQWIAVLVLFFAIYQVSLLQRDQTIKPVGQ